MLPDTRLLLLNGVEYLQDKGATPDEDYSYEYVTGFGLYST